MDKYLIAVDIDGTLITSKKKISFLTKRYLRKLSKKHVVILASGRPPRSLWGFYQKLKLDTPLICYNGAYVYNPGDKSFPVLSDIFPKETILKIYKDLYPKYVSNFCCESQNNMYFHEYYDEMDYYFWYKGMNIKEGKLDEIMDEDVWTCIVSLKKEKLDDEIIKEVKKYDGLNIRFWRELPYGELFFERSSKWSGIEHVAKYYNIPNERIVCIGDASNDIEMLQNAGVGIAMKNAADRIKAYADVVSESDCNHNGVYKALKKIFK